MSANKGVRKNVQELYHNFARENYFANKNDRTSDHLHIGADGKYAMKKYPIHREEEAKKNNGQTRF